MFDSLWPHGLQQAPLSMGFSRKKILEWVAVSFSRGSSPPRGWTQVYLHCRWILCSLSHQGSPDKVYLVIYLYSNSLHTLIWFPDPSSELFSSLASCSPLFRKHLGCDGGFPGGASGKEFACQYRRHKRRGLDPWVGKIPWSGKWQPTLVFLPGKSHG